MPHYPTPRELGIRVPRHLRKDRFNQGFEHALKGGQLHRVEYLKLSFREGFRAAKLYLRGVRRQQGIVDFPLKAQVHTRVVY